MMDVGNVVRLFSRQQGGGKDAGQELLDLLKNPYNDQLQAASMYSALAISLPVTIFIAFCFSLLRPYHQAIYAPKMKHADEKHAPPPIGKAPWSWITTLWKTKEEQLVYLIGMDATIFLRFVRMCRNMFLTLCVTGVGILLPVHVSHWKTIGDDSGNTWVSKITPLHVWGQAIWAQVVIAWVFNIIIAIYLWFNYRKVLQLRRKYFESEEYQKSLHSRTLMVYDIPKKGCSDEGIARIIDTVAPNSSFARTAVARNVKELPSLISQHDHAVRKLESILAKYLKDPNNVPVARPMCRPSKKDRSYGTYPKGQKVDAIEYYTQRIRDLEVQIKEVRASVDKRGSMPYGFASYSDIAEAHSIAYSCRKKKPVGATVRLAPRPNDIIWENMPLYSATRSRRRWINNFWITLLTFFWVIPNLGIAIFLVNLQNLGSVWPAFNRTLTANPKSWGIVQGIASPALMSLTYLVLPIIFRRLSIKAGDQTKTGRERHVLAKLYFFFVFNNLIIFSVFSVIWTFVSGVVRDTSSPGATDIWKIIVKNDIANLLFGALCTNSPFWVTYLLQRQLGAAIDLAQLWPLVQAFFLKKLGSPTPRELIDLTAPPPFEYASYYNYFLFYATVTMCFAGIQPLVLPATAMYFVIDSWLKKYLLLYRFVTKTESGGMFWRVIFNRFIFATMLSNLVVMLTCWVRGDGNHLHFYCIVPLPFLMLFFKIYCNRAFDNKIRYYTTQDVNKNTENGMNPKESRVRSERLANRFGHPALYKPLITPMVHAKAQNLLPGIYKGRLTDGREVNQGDMMSVSGYSDMYALDPMQGGKPGKTANSIPGFEYVSDTQMDFEFYKNRAEFAEDHGGGEIYGRPGEIMRPDTPGSWDGSDSASRPGTPVGRSASPFNPGQQRLMSMSSTSDTSYSAYRPAAPAYGGFTQQATMGSEVPSRGRSPLYSQNNGSSSGLGLIQNAQAPPVSNLTPGGRMTPSVSPGPSVGAMGGGPRGYSGLAQNEEMDAGDPSQYDYFRGGSRTRRTPGEGW
ncbi:hypothetical protein NW767_001589 [Fusarium falciforme]|uniref:DUF221-domain-containing protein n=2 Tax=Fusarium falciforme TaxID=195108 RepID=A0A9W8QUT6_9HYPO|nr:hypothetical protein NW755_013337 [Fusarium falciforme]KAJ4208483.1 hypothetical protein NW767_001589 [Fusarium falciforme]KAJ4257802.1 hypothetical protein NW757_003428 [Fusarium falciforme]